MARIRTVKPEFFTSLSIAALSIPARLTFVGLWTYCDDEGRGKDDARLIRAALWPLDDVTVETVDGWITEMTGQGLVIRYQVDGRQYLQIRSWAEHQRVDKPRPSTFPGPELSGSLPRILPDDSTNTPRSLPEASGEEWNGMEVEREGNLNLPPESAAEKDKPNGVSDDQWHLLRRLSRVDSTWTERMPWGGFNRQQQRFGRPVVTEALRQLASSPNGEATDPLARLVAFCQVVEQQERERQEAVT